MIIPPHSTTDAVPCFISRKDVVNVTLSDRPSMSIFFSRTYEPRGGVCTSLLIVPLAVIVEVVFFFS